ncbi:MAG: Ig-like domain-containing protein [Aquabacterium sp.]|nr:Ig-like domain-containing protein [Aquabacterium sp.]
MTPTTPLAEGAHAFSATATNAAGAVSPHTADYGITIDTAGPDAPGVSSITDDVGAVQGPIANGATTDDTTPTVNGSGEPGATIKVYDNGNLIGTTTVKPDGSWSLTPATPLAEGPHSITSTATDAAGNTSPPSAPQTFTIDTTAPNGGQAPAVLITEDANQDGTISSSEAKGNIDVQIAFQGNLVDVGDIVKVTAGGVTQDVVVTDADKTRGYVTTSFDPQTDGSTFKATAIIVDTAGNTTAPGSASAVIDTHVPICQIQVDPVTSDNFLTTNEAAQNVAITGQVSSDVSVGSTVTLTINNRVYTGSVQADKHFSIDVAGADLRADSDKTIQASVTTTTGSGQTITATDQHSYEAVCSTSGVATQHDDTASKVYATSDGGHWLFYASNDASGGSNNYGLFAQRFDASGAKVGATITIADSASGSDGYDASHGLNYIYGYDVSVNANDSFAVYYTEGSGHNGHFANFDANGKLVGTNTLISGPHNEVIHVSGNPEMQQNDTTTWESPPVIETLADGRWVAVWCKNGLSDDTKSMTVQARIFNADGTPSTDEFQVGQWAVDGTDGFDVPAMTVNQLAGGQVVVGYVRSWVEAGGAEPVFSVFDPHAPGQAVSVIRQDIEMQQSDTTSVESPPVIEALSDGRFVAIWCKNGTSDNIKSMTVQARIFNADGSASTDEFQVGHWAVDGTDGYDVPNMTVHQLTGGQVVVGYVRSYAEAGGDEPVFSVFDPNAPGQAVSFIRQDIEMQQNDTTGWESPPVIEALADGRFMAVWSKDGLSDDIKSMTVQARIFNADGSPSTDEFRVGTASVDGWDGFNVPTMTINQLAGGQVVVGYVLNRADAQKTNGNWEEPIFTVIDPHHAGQAPTTIKADVHIQQFDTTNVESPPVITTLSDGRFMAVWYKNADLDDTQSMTVHARVFHADGTPSTDEFKVSNIAVDGTDCYDVPNITVKELAGGDIVVGYERNYAEFGGDEPVYAIIRSDAIEDGQVVTHMWGGKDMQQNDTTTWESPPVIETLADGRWVAVWCKDGLCDDTKSMMVQARIFNADGTPSTDEFRIGHWAVDGTDGYDVPNMTVNQLAGGQVVVSYIRSFAEAGGDEPVFSVFDPHQAGQAISFIRQDVGMQQNDTTLWESPPVIEALSDGRFVAIWCKDGLSDNVKSMTVQARIFNADGSASTNEFQVGHWAVDGTDGYDVPTMTVHQLTGGQVVVGYVRSYAEAGGDEPVFSVFDPKAPGQAVSFIRQDVEMQQNDTTCWESPPVIEALADGRFMAVWSKDGLFDDTKCMTVQARIFNADGSPSTNEFRVGTVGVDGWDGFNVPTMTINQLAGGQVVVGYVLNRADAEMANGHWEEPIFTVIDPHQAGQAISVIRADVHMQQNDTTNVESPPVIEALADGRFIAVWYNNADCDNTQSMTIQARLFNADGTPSGDQFQVGQWAVDGTDGYDVPHITVKQLVGGDVVVGYVRNYAELGSDAPVYDIIKVSGPQIDPTIVAMDDGSHVLVYASNVGSGYDLYQVRVDKNGQVLDTKPTQLTDPSGTEAFTSGFARDLGALVGNPAGKAFSLGSDGLAAVNLGNGKYAVSYMEVKTATPKDANIYMKVYDFATGKQVGGEQLVSTNTAGIQFAPHMTHLKNGDVLVTWSSNSASATMTGFEIYSRHFSLKNGALVATDAEDVLMTGHGTGSDGVLSGAVSAHHSVAAMADGGYVLAWSKATSDTQSDVYAQRYDAAGHKMGDETQLAAHSDNAAGLMPSVTGLADGSGYAVSWTSNNSAAEQLDASHANAPHNADNIVTVIVQGADHIISGSGVMTGGLGSDVFKWSFAEDGTAGHPVRDTVVDFTKGAGGDVLDLRDLLQGEHGDSLTQYLHFSGSGSDTLVQISSKGSFDGNNHGTATDHEILLKGVTVDSLAGGNHSDAQIISELLKHNLKVDV